MSKRYKTKGGKKQYKEDLSKEYMKCAPSKKYDGTCFTLLSLNKMCHAYNDYIKEDIKKDSHYKKNSKIIRKPIEINNDKKTLITGINRKIISCMWKR